MLSFEVGFGVGAIFSEVNLTSPVFWIFTVAGALIASVAFGAISERGFKGYKKSLIMGSVSAAAVLLLTACYAFDIIGFENVDKVIGIDQSAIGRTPRSNPATYTGVFGDIRTLFAQTQDAKMRGYQPGRFSFNVKGPNFFG